MKIPGKRQKLKPPTIKSILTCNYLTRELLPGQKKSFSSPYHVLLVTFILPNFRNPD